MTDKSPLPAHNANSETTVVDDGGTPATASASVAGPSSAVPVAAGESIGDAGDGDGGGTTERKSKKKTRLQWDEENLQLNALEMERNPKMKIDEPKTPFERGPGSEAGSSTSGSAPGSPAPYFIPKERLRGFDALEASNNANNANVNGYSEVGNSLRRSVQIVDERNPAEDGSPSGSNDEFIAKRRKHYANEARLMRAECEEDRSRDSETASEPLGSSVYNAPAPADMDNASITTNHNSISGNGNINIDAEITDDGDTDGLLPNGHSHTLLQEPNGTT